MIRMAEVYCIHSRKECIIYDNVAITTQTMNIYASCIDHPEINGELILVFTRVCYSNVAAMEEIGDYSYF